MGAVDEGSGLLALIEGGPFVSGAGSDRGLAAVVAARAVEYGNQFYVEVDMRGVESSVLVSTLYERAWGLVPLLESAVSNDAAVVVCVESVLDYVPAAWACIFSGRTFVSLAYNGVSARDEQSKSNLKFIAGKLSQPVLVTTRAVSERLQLGETGGFGGVIFVDDLVQPDAIGEVGQDLVCSVDGLGDRVSDESAAFLVLTSGSSGIPKLVEISFEQMLNRWALFYQESGEDQALTLRPFDAAFMPIYLLFAKPDGLVYMSPDRAFADPRGVLGLVARRQVHHIISANSFFGKLVEAIDEEPFEGDLSCLRSVRSGGEMNSLPVAVGLGERLQGLGVSDLESRFGYGSSEAGYVSMISLRELAQGSTSSTVSGAVSQGQPYDGTSLRVVDEAGELVRQSEVGEIETRCDSQMFSGYYGDPDATGAAFTADGWFRTGDLGFVDRVGVTVVGRTSGMIIANGRNISLAQIDGLVHGVSGIKGQLAACAPVRTPESVTDELAVFFVPVQDTESGLSEVCREIKRQVAMNCGVAVKHLVALGEQDFARTRTGKVDRNELVARLERGTLSVLSNTFTEPAPAVDGSGVWQERLSERWCQVLGLGVDAGRSGGFFDLGGDSLKFAELVVGIDDEFGIQIPAQRFFENPVLSNLIGLVGEIWSGHARSGHAESAKGGSGGVGLVPAQQVMRRLEALLSSWTGDRVSESSLMVGANTSGKRAPIVWICQSNREFVTLAKALGPDQPVYGLRSLNQLVEFDELTSEILDTISYRYMAEILALRTEQSLVIGGNCSGAIIALAVARKAPHFGVEPRLLVLLNWMFSFGRYDGPVVLLQGMQGASTFALTNTEGQPIDWRSDFPAAEPHILPGEHGKYFRGAPLKAFAAQLRKHTNTPPKTSEQTEMTETGSDWPHRGRSIAKTALAWTRRLVHGARSRSRLR